MLLMSEEDSPNWHDYTDIFCVLICLSLTVMCVDQKLLNETKLYKKKISSDWLAVSCLAINLRVVTFVL